MSNEKYFPHFQSQEDFFCVGFGAYLYLNCILSNCPYNFKLPSIFLCGVKLENFIFYVKRGRL
jgi:hypothetical protein